MKAVFYYNIIKNTLKYVEVAFTNKLTFDSLVHITNKMKSLGVDVKYSKLSFDKNDKLVSIGCSVYCKNSRNGGSFFTANLNALSQKIRKRKGKYGFYYNYGDHIKNSFAIGFVLN